VAHIKPSSHVLANQRMYIIDRIGRVINSYGVRLKWQLTNTKVLRPLVRSQRKSIGIEWPIKADDYSLGC
jgi:hypothetical protein